MLKDQIYYISQRKDGMIAEPFIGASVFSSIGFSEKSTHC